MTDQAAVRRAAALVDASPAAALRLLAPYLASEPDDGYATCLAAQAQLELGRSEDALRLARRAAVLSPADEWPLRLQALALHHLGQHAQTQELARLCVLADPGSWQTHHLVGCADLWAGAVTRHSLAAAERARELAPAEPQTHELIGQLALASRKSRLAIRSLERALKLDPESSVARHELARAHMRRMRLASAIKGFLAVGRMDPTIPEARINLHNVAIRLVQLLHYATFLACMLSRSSAQASAALVLALVVGALLWGRYRGGPALRWFAAGIPRRDPLLVAWAALLLLSGSLLVLRGALTLGTPADADADSGLARVALFLVLASVVTAWIRWTRRPRAGRSVPS